MDLIGWNKCGDVYFGLICVFVNPAALASSFSKRIFTLPHVCFSILLSKPPICGVQRARHWLLSVLLGTCMVVFIHLLFCFCQIFVLLNDTVCSHVENQQHNEASLASLFPIDNSGHVSCCPYRQNKVLPNYKVDIQLTIKKSNFKTLESETVM